MRKACRASDAWREKMPYAKEILVARCSGF